MPTDLAVRPAVQRRPFGLWRTLAVLALAFAARVCQAGIERLCKR